METATKDPFIVQFNLVWPDTCENPILRPSLICLPQYKKIMHRAAGPLDPATEHSTAKINANSLHHLAVKALADPDTCRLPAGWSERPLSNFCYAESKSDGIERCNSAFDSDIPMGIDNVKDYLTQDMEEAIGFIHSSAVAPWTL
ncbi:MAG: hypothetical protein J3Q66DRAFT_404455 [Benniella sp.]|nr:MAG: hypothetical protein J3Q66DRAFT_404455 [Benniella sp.]